ncbi:solute carrier family 35 member G1-like [Uloborus diversus]|uniref:solute carrier family 35 member G1-like n=1 Tax=Uloborus diversus TaxID=327109 RepID=UPI00240980FC|nr:solute carrier family 35 member G1-like [Uloborus diversus]
MLRHIFDRRKKYKLDNGNISTLSTPVLFQKTLTDLTVQKKKQKSTTCKINYKPFLCLFYVLLCSVFITLTSAFVKKMTYISPGELSMIRNAGVLVFNLPIAVYNVREVFGPKEHRWMLILRGVLGSLALYLNLLAFRYLPLADAAIILATLPAFVTVSGRIYLKEPCDGVQICALVTTALGVLISVRIPELVKDRSGITFNIAYVTGLICAIADVLILSFSFVTLRKMKDIHFSVILIYFGWTGVLENGILNGIFEFYEVQKCGWDTVQVLLIGIAGFLGHISLVLAFQIEAAGIVSIMKSSFDIIVAMLFQILFFNSIPDLYSIAGGILVLLSVTLLGIKNWIASQPENSAIRMKCRYLLC